MSSILKTKAKDPTHAVFGTDLEGKTFSLPVSSGPHWIIAGQTGSGKSVFVNGIAISMISHSDPSELKIAWIDPKKVEATAYIDLPYSLVNPITDMQDAYGFMSYMAWLMDERFEILAKYGVKQISELNEMIDADPEWAKREGLEKMAYLICIIDEYADMTMQVPEVEKNIVRLGQKGRAAGTHVIVCTQRPSVDVISSLLKANVPSRVGLRTVNSVNSSIVIDETGCEELKGNGDALVKDVGGTITRVQGPYITNEEIDSIFSYLREKYPPMEEFDYKTKVVDLGLCEWADTYTDDVPFADRHVVPVKRRGRF